MQSTTKAKTLILSVAALLALAIILLVLALTVWSPPGKQDFEAARVLTGQTHKSYQSMTSAANRYTMGFAPLYDEGKTFSEVETATARNKEAFEKAYQKHVDDLDDLAGHKALRDEELGKAFKPYQTHDTKFSIYIKDYLDSWPLYMRVVNVTCSDVFTAVKQVEAKDKSSKQYFAEFADKHKAAAEDCLKDLEVLSKSNNKPLATYAKEFSEYVDGRQTAMEKAASGELPIILAQQKLLVDLPKQFKTANDTFAADYQEEIEALASQKLFDAFEKAIAKKAKEAKKGYRGREAV